MCDDRIAALVDYAEATLAPQDRRALEAHLEACEHCRQELALLHATTAQLTGTRPDPHPLSTGRFVARTTDAAERHRDGSFGGLWWSMTRGVRLGLTASLASLVAALYLAAGSLARPTAAPNAPAAPLASSDSKATETTTELDPSIAYETGFDGLDEAELEALDQLLDTSET